MIINFNSKFSLLGCRVGTWPFLATLTRVFTLCRCVSKKLQLMSSLVSPYKYTTLGWVDHLSSYYVILQQFTCLLLLPLTIYCFVYLFFLFAVKHLTTATTTTTETLLFVFLIIKQNTLRFYMVTYFLSYSFAGHLFHYSSRFSPLSLYILCGATFASWLLHDFSLRYSRFLWDLSAFCAICSALVRFALTSFAFLAISRCYPSFRLNTIFNQMDEQIAFCP